MYYLVVIKLCIIAAAELTKQAWVADVAVIAGAANETSIFGVAGVVLPNR